MNLRHSLFLIPCSLFILFSCSVTKQISKQADAILLKDSAIRTGHIGISIYESATNRYWYNYNANRYFIPASNSKLFTLYAGMKYLGDSLIAGRLKTSGNSITVYPSGDPTFLNAEFKFQPLLKTLSSFKTIYIFNNTWKDEALGNGWAWNDYTESYMTERSSLPVFNNLIEFNLENNIIESSTNEIDLLSREGFESPIQFDPAAKKVASDKFRIERSYGTNEFYIKDATSAFRKVSVPFRTETGFIASLLKDTLKADDVTFFTSTSANITYPDGTYILRSQPVDSLFKPMMHRSDNFFAEQTLLMASNEHLGYMSDEAMIDTLLKSDLKDVPQRPRWVDGSGLSRYNLFTPLSFVYILNKMRNEFGWDRLKNILPTGGAGTLGSYYKNEAGFIYAKTGTLSNNCALSGYIITKKGRFLIFSVMVNNYMSAATPVRRAVERFLIGIRENY